MTNLRLYIKIWFMKIFSFVGWSESGKTTLISALITLFKQKKRRIIALKNVPNHYSVQPEGKDTWNFLQAGADAVFLTSNNEILSIKKRKSSIDLLEELKPQFKKFDLVLLEGLTGKGIPAIEVFNSKKNKKMKFKLNLLSAVISYQKMNLDIPWFDINGIHKIAQYMEEYNGQ